MRFPILIAVGSLVGSQLLGCGHSGPDKVIVQGEVTYGGEPIANGDILFYPVEGTPGAVSGASISAGRYLADGKGGVPIGKHRVEVRGYRKKAAERSSSNRFEEPGVQREQYLPEKFNTKSTLVVSFDGANPTAVQDFQLGN
jgi:hypothetical protein